MNASPDHTIRRPRIALAMGDPAGASPELTARLLADREVTSAGQILVIGDSRVLAEGARVAQVALDIDSVDAMGKIPDMHDRPLLLDLGHLDPRDIKIGEISKAGGSFALENFKTALTLAVAKKIDVVTFTPFNKAAMRLAHPSYEDEIVFISEMLTTALPASSIFFRIYGMRASSHVRLSGVAALITKENILRNLRLTDQAMRDAGFAAPRIAVAGLNRHAGDGGNFGREEIDVIEPAVRQAKAAGIVCDGPVPPDTVFVRARKGEFDGVLTMYHDQGQIAMKLVGFDQGVTLLGGFPVPFLTPAHGSAYDIAGKGVANPGASRAALLLAAKMGAKRIVAKSAV
jgi:4-hydroxythreonine-4-phosphate dehydrogenase